MSRAPEPLPAAAEPLRMLSVVIPARDEQDGVAATLRHLHDALEAHAIPHEIIVVDDGSTDSTWTVLQETARTLPVLRPMRNEGPRGFGCAIRWGLDRAAGDAVAIVMADESDDPQDVVLYWNTLQQGYDCVFGSRFIQGGQTVDYPAHKYVLNRLANTFIQILFGIRLNDTTNAFKAYRMRAIQGCKPLLSMHFNLTVELPLKAICRGYSWTVVPIRWRNRKTGVAKLKIKEMGSRYFFIVMYVWLEKYFSRGDYRAQTPT